MLNKIKLLFVAFAITGVQWSFAQVDLKKLRAKPDTNFVDKPAAPLSNLNQVLVPIPKLQLEVDYWKHWTKFGINANQASFSENWSAGGVNSIAVGALAWHKSEYNKNNFQFTTELDLRYGKIKNKDQLAKKNNDRIFWDNKLAYKLSNSWALYFSVTFESQFDIGYTYTTEQGVERIYEYQSSFMGPAYFTESFGLEYKPDNTFSLRLGTGTARQTLVLDDRVGSLTVEEYARRYPENRPISQDQEKFGLKPGESFRNDLAFQLTANLDRNLSKNLNLKSRYNMFADYKDLSDPDHRLDAVLTAKITSLVNVSLTGIVVYNSSEAPKVQYSQALALGLTYSLPR
ncbi:Protein of unknown function (DUF3078) [Sphingobacterium allocomposti]|uniref:DUF3078 family protein n=1 Tax=Sphingobacterium allocomposti TaxID=415956 RepID=A0A5S5D2G7_9SPHI|nr:DUF3078 domain-containing protein [Sphingobacterium composti Yoo et al. 2007 non Ten et al. 2007]TYP90237.1 Protein of unknown function (DUF3078) [Sphingobacterium composti Yoo et al. 2007 non Ten et al. 2007]